VILAAFIGPRTVATAAKAGASFGFKLLWALFFSMLVCTLLQEAVMRICFCTELTLGQALKKSLYQSKGSFFIQFILGIAI
jgi:Mn2+/Fe2+ NRAMP family transporter